MRWQRLAAVGNGWRLAIVQNIYVRLSILLAVIDFECGWSNGVTVAPKNPTSSLRRSLVRTPKREGFFGKKKIRLFSTTDVHYLTRF